MRSKIIAKNPEFGDMLPFKIKDFFLYPEKLYDSFLRYIHCIWRTI